MQNLMPPIGTPDNLFHDGNPLTGEQGTIVTAAHLNNVQGATRDIQTELLAVLVDAKIEVNPEDHAQLLKALKAVIGTFGATKFLSASKNLKEIADAGPDAIAAALQNLQIGSAGKRNVGTGAGQIPDMSAFASGSNWQSLPGGRILLFGSGVVVSGTSPQILDIPFQIPAPKRCLCNVLTHSGDAGPVMSASGRGYIMTAEAASLNGFRTSYRTVSANVNISYSWFAVVE